MPIYTFACEHGHTTELSLRVDHRNDHFQCSRCNSALERQIDRPAPAQWAQGTPTKRFHA